MTGLTSYFKKLLNYSDDKLQQFLHWVVTMEAKVVARHPSYDAQVEIYLIWFGTKRKLVEDAKVDPLSIDLNGFINGKDLEKLAKTVPKVILLYLYDPWKYARGEGISKPNE